MCKTLLGIKNFIVQKIPTIHPVLPFTISDHQIPITKSQEQFTHVVPLFLTDKQSLKWMHSWHSTASPDAKPGNRAMVRVKLLSKVLDIEIEGNLICTVIKAQ